MIAISFYLLAFFCNKKSACFLLAFAFCELVSMAGFFSLLEIKNGGAIVHLVWSAMFSAAALTYAKECTKVNKRIKSTITAVSIMIIYQVMMAIDCLVSPQYATSLYNTYQVIIVLIHCAICLSFVKWSSAKRDMVANIKSILNRIYCVFFNIASKKNIGVI